MSTHPQEPDPVPEGAARPPQEDLPPQQERSPREDLPRPGPGGPGTASDEAPDAATGTGAATDEHAAALDELRDRWRRALAELDNLRKRHAKELERERAAERARTAAALLPVIDNLELALAHAQADPGAILEGVKAVRDQAVDALERLGFPRYTETGVPFDPTRHEVVGVVEDTDAEPGTVVQVLRPGYGDADRQIRPAAVTVAKRE
ncbi:nucleotide exchange factor GrpE [Streptomyces sp. 8N706]|uniref:nucleotide exchange factor GrpE n=1 Tax=Streptomyces sp. 8N706 TaxID=3457416 RepID=UPI003FD3E6A7